MAKRKQATMQDLENEMFRQHPAEANINVFFGEGQKPCRY
jgi:hypothetical protein